MDYQKTGRLIAKKRKAQDYTLEELSKLIGVSPQAISLWENGQRFPDPSSQIMLFKVLGLNPIELLIGLEMFDDDLKADIAKYMNRIDEKVFTAGMVKDEDGNDFYLDLSGCKVVTLDKDGGPTDKLISYADYYNVELPPKPNFEEKFVSEYDPGKIYLNHGNCILTIPVEILESVGNPLYFIILWNHDQNRLGIHFTDELTEDGLDIPQKIYNGKWKGIHVFGGEFGRMLCKKMGIRRRMDLMEITPVYDEKTRTLFLDLEKSISSNVELHYTDYLLPQFQYEEMWEDEDIDE